MSAVDLKFIGEQVARMQREMRTLREDVANLKRCAAAALKIAKITATKLDARGEL